MSDFKEIQFWIVLDVKVADLSAKTGFSQPLLLTRTPVLKPPWLEECNSYPEGRIKLVLWRQIWYLALAGMWEIDFLMSLMIKWIKPRMAGIWPYKDGGNQSNCDLGLISSTSSGISWSILSIILWISQYTTAIQINRNIREIPHLVSFFKRDARLLD